LCTRHLAARFSLAFVLLSPRALVFRLSSPHSLNDRKTNVFANLLTPYPAELAYAELAYAAPRADLLQ
jgi:hypothetical protein